MGTVSPCSQGRIGGLQSLGLNQPVFDESQQCNHDEQHYSAEAEIGRAMAARRRIHRPVQGSAPQCETQSPPMHDLHLPEARAISAAHTGFAAPLRRLTPFS